MYCSVMNYWSYSNLNLDWDIMNMSGGVLARIIMGSSYATDRANSNMASTNNTITYNTNWSGDYSRCTSNTSVAYRWEGNCTTRFTTMTTATTTMVVAVVTTMMVTVMVTVVAVVTMVAMMTGMVTMTTAMMATTMMTTATIVTCGTVGFLFFLFFHDYTPAVSKATFSNF